MSIKLLEKYYMLLFAVVIMLSGLGTYFSAPLELSNLFDTTYLVTGQTLGAGLILLVVNFYLKPHLSKDWILKASIFLNLALMVGFVFVGLHLGGRGPVLSMMLALFIFLGLAYANGAIDIAHRKYIGFILASFICIISALKLTIGLNSIPFFQRMASAFSPHKFDESLALRLSYYKSALKCFLGHPLKGIGLGGWPAYYGLSDVEWHPHNIILEIASETGIFGILSMSLFFSYVFWQFIRQYSFKNSLSTSTLLLLVFAGFNALKSGDINDNILLFTVMGLFSALNTKVK